MKLGGSLSLRHREEMRQLILDSIVTPREKVLGGEMWMYHPRYDGILVSSKGRVVNYYLDLEYSVTENYQGYYTVRINPRNSNPVCKGTYRLVAETFFPYVDSSLYEANHLSGDKSDNSVHNVNWLTRKENLQHARDTGLFKRQMGSSNGRYKYSEDTVNDMAEFRQLGFTCKEIAEAYGTTVNSIYHIMQRRIKYSTLDKEIK